MMMLEVLFDVVRVMLLGVVLVGLFDVVVRWASHCPLERERN